MNQMLTNGPTTARRSELSWNHSNSCSKRMWHVSPIETLQLWEKWNLGYAQTYFTWDERKF